MEKRDNIRKANHHNSILLFTILIGFCILAIMEILYGHAQIRTARESQAQVGTEGERQEQIGTEGESAQIGMAGEGSAQEKMGGKQNGSTKPANPLRDAKDASSDSMPGQDASEEKPTEDDSEYAMQIVVLGDSIMADQRENNQDVPTLIGEALDAKVYNLAIGGTTAALLKKEQYNFESWSSTGLLGVVNAIVGNIDPDVFEGYETEQILKECDFSQTDYFVIEYGINDFTSQQIPQSKYLENGEILGIDSEHTYVGAMEDAVSMLESHFPNARILIISPHYCQFFDGTKFVGDAYSLDYGYGTLVDYFRCAGYVADQHRTENTIFFNAMEESEIDAYTAEKYLEDGIHLSTLGRRMYADEAARRIYKDFYRAE